MKFLPYYKSTPKIESLLKQIEELKKNYAATVQKSLKQQKINLLPRRAEIVDIIRDHDMVSFNFIARRFAAVPKSTLHFDIQQLLKKKYIKKLGTTRGVVYTIIDA